MSDPSDDEDVAAADEEEDDVAAGARPALTPEEQVWDLRVCMWAEGARTYRRQQLTPLLCCDWPLPLRELPPVDNKHEDVRDLPPLPPPPPRRGKHPSRAHPTHTRGNQTQRCWSCRTRACSCPRSPPGRALTACAAHAPAPQAPLLNLPELEDPATASTALTTALTEHHVMARPAPRDACNPAAAPELSRRQRRRRNCAAARRRRSRRHRRSRTSCCSRLFWSGWWTRRSACPARCPRRSRAYPPRSSGSASRRRTWCCACSARTPVRGPPHVTPPSPGGGRRRRRAAPSAARRWDAAEPST